MEEPSSLVVKRSSDTSSPAMAGPVGAAAGLPTMAAGWGGGCSVSIGRLPRGPTLTAAAAVARSATYGGATAEGGAAAAAVAAGSTADCFSGEVKAFSPTHCLVSSSGDRAGMDRFSPPSLLYLRWTCRFITSRSWRRVASGIHPEVALHLGRRTIAPTSPTRKMCGSTSQSWYSLFLAGGGARAAFPPPLPVSSPLAFIASASASFERRKSST
mmetsp:Transcript_32626/g.98483  ORF Transcript_32626/g.98483 Transcript_32626/m.98483 type:complete len:214 (-) Transcript_32626:1090-1731(-)